MTGRALLLAGLAALLLWPAPRLLAAARWPLAFPAPALLLWQAIGLAAGLAAVGAGTVYALGALGDSLPRALVAAWHTAPADWPLDAPRWTSLVASALLAGYLLAVAVTVTARTLRTRRRHRQLLDLAADPLPVLPHGHVLDSPTAMAYCLPGLRPRLVVTTAALTELSPTQLRAVVAHEQAHLRQRHDLVVLPFVAWSAALPFLPGTRAARATVALLVEMLADDHARARVGVEPLAGAVRHVGAAAAPDGAPGAVGASGGGESGGGASGGGSAQLLRLHRLATPHASPPALAWLGACAALALIALPTAMLLL